MIRMETHPGLTELGESDNRAEMNDQIFLFKKIGILDLISGYQTPTAHVLIGNPTGKERSYQFSSRLTMMPRSNLEWVCSTL